MKRLLSQEYFHPRFVSHMEFEKRKWLLRARIIDRAPEMADLLRRFVNEADALDEAVLPIEEARKLLKEIEGT